MAAQTLDQIIAQLGSVYEPQVQSLQKQRDLIPEQIKNDETQLQAKQTQSFEDILGGARRRGLGFAGIPLGEQAKYTATEYLPALAKARTQGRQQQLSLEDALSQVYQQRNTQANQMFQFGQQQDLAERQFGEGIRQFNEQMAAKARADAEAARQARAAAAAFSPSFGGGGATAAASGKAPQATPPKTNTTQQNAYDFVKAMAGKGDYAIVSDFNAAKKWYEKTGNQNDYYKLMFYQQLYPKILGKSSFNQPAGLRF